jgi:hypothetical protein
MGGLGQGFLSEHGAARGDALRSSAYCELRLTTPRRGGEREASGGRNKL